jgi:uncharacterized membrane protein
MEELEAEQQWRERLEKIRDMEKDHRLSHIFDHGNTVPRDADVTYYPEVQDVSVDVNCQACGDKFDPFYNQGDEMWCLDKAVRSEDIICHPICYEDCVRE